MWDWKGSWGWGTNSKIQKEPEALEAHPAALALWCQSWGEAGRDMVPKPQGRTALEGLRDSSHNSMEGFPQATGKPPMEWLWPPAPTLNLCSNPNRSEEEFPCSGTPK